MPLKKILFLLFIITFLSSCTKNSNNNLSPVGAGFPSPTQTLPTSTPTPIPTLTLGLLGDLGLGRNITFTARQKQDFTYSFSGMLPWLLSNDLNSANLESPIVASCPSIKTNTFKFCGDPLFLPSLVSGHFFLNLANNHILNYGQVGLQETEKYLTDNALGYVYSHQKSTEFTQKTVNGITLGFLGFDLTGSQQRPSNPDILALVKKYDSQVDHLIVHIHGGNEYEPVPESWKQEFYRSLVDAGADIVQGHHPHVWQGSEVYRGKYIYYSLGNFIFDQSWSAPTSQSFAIRLTLTKNEIIKEEKQPYIIRNNSRPEPAEELTAYPFRKQDIL